MSSEDSTNPAQLDVIGELTKLRCRVTDLGLVNQGDGGRLAGAYHEYVDLLISVYEGFLAQL